MKELTLKKYPEKILRKKLDPVEKIGDEEKEILKKMLSVMYQSQGVGLAANQVGVDKRMFVADLNDGQGAFFVINPKILKKEGGSKMEEGCLSIPGAAVSVKRAKKIILEGLSLEGELVKIEASGLLARVFQHEMDHLNGRLIIDYLNFPSRLKAFSFLKKKENNRLFENRKIENRPQ